MGAQGNHPNNFCHFELNTSDVGKAQGFYKKLFDWKIAKYPGMEYLGIDTGSKHSGGGIQKSPMPEAPPAWLPYVEVKDVKKTLAQAKKLGARIVMPYMEIPNNGSIGVFVDPTGAGLGVWAKKVEKKKKR